MASELVGGCSVPVSDGPVSLYNKSWRKHEQHGFIYWITRLCTTHAGKVVECNWRVERLNPNKCKNSKPVLKTKNISSGRSGPPRTWLWVLS